MPGITTIASTGPHDLELSLRATAAFTHQAHPDPSVLRIPLRLEGRALVAEVRQSSRRPAVMEVSASPALRGARRLARLEEAVGWVVFADLDLRSFYKLTRDHPVMGTLTRRLYGLKPSRPASLFDMAVIAVTEQQISMAAAYRIRQRLIEAYGETVGGLALYPSPEALAARGAGELKAMGLSGMKAEYIIGLARGVVEGSVNLDSLKMMGDDEAREYITSWRGFGPWAAEYMLVRGLGRSDVVPADDLGIRTLVGRYLGGGSRMSAAEVRQALAPFEPWRGLAAFYLLASLRLPE